VLTGNHYQLQKIFRIGSKITDYDRNHNPGFRPAKLPVRRWNPRGPTRIAPKGADEHGLLPPPYRLSPDVDISPSPQLQARDGKKIVVIPDARATHNK